MLYVYYIPLLLVNNWCQSGFCMVLRFLVKGFHFIALHAMRDPYRLVEVLVSSMFFFCTAGCCPSSSSLVKMFMHGSKFFVAFNLTW